VIGPEFAGQMGRVLDADMAQSEEITRQEWSERSLKERLKELGARVWARML
jgi:cardiolipin synthase A/B